MLALADEIAARCREQVLGLDGQFLQRCEQLRNRTPSCGGALSQRCWGFLSNDNHAYVMLPFLCFFVSLEGDLRPGEDHAFGLTVCPARRPAIEGRLLIIQHELHVPV